ncbi:lysine decarboxylase [Staphylococcus aureus]
MKLPLTNKLYEILKRNPISMHVPGHKNMTIGNLDQLNFKMDMTEITELDDLHHPEEILLDSMEMIEKHPDYDAYYLVNGTTSGILSVIQSFSGQNGYFSLVRNSHKSVFHGLDISGEKCKLLEMDMSKETNQYLGPKVSTLLSQVRQTKLAVFTYPNYYGECFNVSSAIKQLKSQNVPVLVDEAHGAHFDLEGFPNSTLNMGADYVVQSYHKSLPSLTMSSILFIHKNAAHREKVIKYLSYFQSSSPSYLFMTSLELAHQFYQHYDSTLFFEKRSELIQVLTEIGIEIVSVEDPLKLNLRCSGYTGFELQKCFEDKDIYIELADNYQVLFVLPLWHKDDQYPFDLLIEKIHQIKLEVRVTKKENISGVRTEQGIYQAGEIEKTRSVPINQSNNQTLATHIVPYPPGIPVMFKGEKITENMIELMNYWYDNHIRVEGIKNYKIEIKDE